jgi:tetratricopeptide (TPR) repeat protein
MPADASLDDSSRMETLAACVRAGRHDEALALAKAAIDDGLDHPLPLRIAAAALAQVGRFDEALILHERCVRLAPGDPAVRAGLAECLFAAQRPEAALEAWDGALLAAPADVTLMTGKARVLIALGRAEEAARLLRRALAADPASLPAAFGLARLALEAGDLEEADALAQRLLARAPGQPDFLWLAARLALGRGEPETAGAQLVRILDQPGLNPEQRAEVLLELGQALDALGRPSEAFAAAVEGKAIQRGLYAARAAGRESETAKLERLDAWFASADPAAWGPAPSLGAPVEGEAAAHAFLAGFPRSGTTLLEQALAGHPEVQTLEEAPTLAETYAEFLSSSEGCARLAGLDGAGADRWRASYWAVVRAQGVDTARGGLFLDKAPAGTLTLPLIAKLFPRARILFAVRDPRDVVLSCLRSAFQMNAMTYEFTSLEGTASCYRAGMAMARTYRRVLALEIMDVGYENLVEDFEARLAAIATFLGLTQHPSMLDIAATAAGRTVRTPSARQVRTGLNNAGVGRWRAYAQELAPVRTMLAPWIETFGYPAA